jgi:hypothetical protein
MKRRLLNLASALSLLVCAAALVLLVVGFWFELGYERVGRAGGWVTRAEVFAAQGMVCFVRTEYGLDETSVAAAYGDVLLRQQRRGYSLSLGDTAVPPMRVLLRPAIRRGGPGRGPFYSIQYVAVDVPLALVVPLTAALPGFCLTAASRRRRRQSGLCSPCGYDLRATSGPCPECGEIGG